MSARLFASSVLLVCAFLLPGCSTPKAKQSQHDPDLVKSVSFWQPHLTYLLASPHPRLYVEVDAVEGCAPSEATLNKLRDFLATHCNKPGGIDIARSDVIQFQAARGMSPGALANKYLDGPPDNTAGPPPAFIYVLCYDSALKHKRPATIAIHKEANAVAGSRHRVDNPHVDLLPYPAMIFMNTRYAAKSVQDLLLLHETGHVLGLAGWGTNAANYHCLDDNCLMHPTIFVRMSRLLTGRDPITQRQLCKQCAALLAGNSQRQPPANLRFVGPMLVRSEADYHVLCLPNRVKVIMGDLSEKDCREFAAAVHAEELSPGEGGSMKRCDGMAKEEVLREPTKLSEIINRATADPMEPVRIIAPRLLLFCADRFCAKGQFNEAINACRQAIRVNPKDDLSYNQLAWIKATSSDASVRDGKEAVSAATKACELTEWKNGNWIDTLAAAYAEAGDFKRAVEFQEQALHMGNPSQSEQKQMQERLSLYRQSQPFRDKP